MRFHVSAVIQCREPSRIPRMLEELLRDVTIEIVRTGEEMTLIGFGPGAVSMNKDDRTVLALEKLADAMIIEADGVFDGAYLDQPMAQEAEVRSKLEGIFKALQQRIDLEEGEKPVKRFAATIQPAEQVVSAIVAPAMEVAPMPVGIPGVKAGQHRPVNLAALNGARLNRVADAVPASYRQVGFFAATAIGVALVAASIDGIQTLIRRDGAGMPAVKESLHVTQPMPAQPLATAATHPDSSKSARDSTAVSVAPERRFSDTSADPSTWLVHWERAMRTRDAAAQSSFYADPVERYQGQAHMSKADVEQKKRAAIAGRKGLWTMKVEGFVIQKQTKDSVEIQLVKHFIDQPAPAQISEQFVQTQLRLKRMHDEWKIVSEEDLEESPNPLDPRS